VDVPATIDSAGWPYLDQGDPDPRPFMGPADGLHPVESISNQIYIRSWNTDAGVFDSEVRLAGSIGQDDMDVTRHGIFQSIPDQIKHDLLLEMSTPVRFAAKARQRTDPMIWIDIDVARAEIAFDNVAEFASFYRSAEQSLSVSICTLVESKRG
jgi:hypothetical protein